MHYAIIGCIHGNRAALAAVLEDISKRDVERIICLGDVVGFGPEPIECLELVRERCFLTVRGDHDEAVLSGSSQGFIGKTARILDWTREQVAHSGAGQEVLQKSVASFVNAGIHFHHGSPRSNAEFLFPADVRRDPRKLRAVFGLIDKVCFHAHTHVPGVILSEPLGWTPAQELDGHFHYRKGTKALVNVGSVGQPRDGDPRACYLEIKKNEMFWRRVEYDVDTTVAELRANPVFAEDLAIRLQKGR